MHASRRFLAKKKPARGRLPPPGEETQAAVAADVSGFSVLLSLGASACGRSVASQVGGLAGQLHWEEVMED